MASVQNAVTRRAGLALVCALLLACGRGTGIPPSGQRTLRIADSLPNNHVIHRIITLPFMAEVERASAGRIRFQHFPGEQLGKARDLLELTQAGIAHVGYVVPAYRSDRMPLTAALELPGMFTDYCQASAALWALTHAGGYLERHEFTPNKVIPIVSFMLPPYQMVFATRRTVASARDLAGLKVRSAGGAMDFLPTFLGMVPVRMTPPEIYEGLSRGTIDGAILPYQSALSYRLGAVLRAGTIDATFGTIVLTYSIGEPMWQQLPTAVRAVLLQVGERTSREACVRLADAEDAAAAAIQQAGMQPIAWSASADPALAGVFDRVQREWAASLDRRGKPGSEALTAIREALSREPRPLW